jgi:hypothetical protein
MWFYGVLIYKKVYYICLSLGDNLNKQIKIKIMIDVKLTPKQKKKMLAKMIELMVNMGHNIEPYICLPPSRFNYESVQKRIEQLKNDLEYVNAEY